MIQLNLVLLAALLAPIPVFGLDQTDEGIYAIVHVDGHVTDKLFQLTRPNGNWKVEDKKSDGSWEDVSCGANCVMVESSAANVKQFLEKAPNGMEAECINNSSFAICRATDQAKLGERQYLLVALTQLHPIILRLARQAPAQEGWRNQQGGLASDTEARKAVGGFGGWMIITSDGDWKEKWETPSTNTPKFTEAKNVLRGNKIFVLTFFANPQISAKGEADITCDIDVTKPDGMSSTHQEGVVCFKGTLKEPRFMYLSVPVIGFVGDPDDPAGEWQVRMTLKDNVRHVAVPLKSSFTLLDKR